MSHLNEWVIQVNGSFEGMDHLQMGHLSEWVSHTWVIQVNGSFEGMDHLQMGHLSEWVIQANGSFKQMGRLND